MKNGNQYQYLLENLNVLVNGKIGYFYVSAVNIQKVANPYNESKGFKDTHFEVNIPYAGKKLLWDIIFDPENLSEVPDFDFNDNTFLPEPDIDAIAKNVPSWDNWNLQDPNAVLNILREFLELFKKAQVEKLRQNNIYSQIFQEYVDLLKIKNIYEPNVEVYIESRNQTDVLDNDFGCVTFFIYLPIDFSDLPEYYQEELEQEGLLNPGDDYAFLQVQMKKPDRSQNRFALQLSPRTEQTLGKFKMPKCNKDATLSEYVLYLQRSIEDQIQEIADQHRKKNLFISTVVNAYSSSIIEYNNKSYNKIVFMFEEFEEYDCMVTITLGIRFPQDRPKVHLSSIYCQAGKTCNHPLTFVYQPTLSIEEIVENIVVSLKEEVKNFQNHRH